MNLLRKTKAEERSNAEFDAAFEAWITGLGAERGEHAAGVICVYTWKLETKAGTLLVSSHGDWVSSRFTDVERAKQFFPHGFGDVLNRYSGKYNVGHFDGEHTTEKRMGHVKQHLEPILNEVP